MAERLSVNKAMTGLTFQGTAGQPGMVTNVFYHHVEDLAKSKTCSKAKSSATLPLMSWATCFWAIWTTLPPAS
jgi:hypothetical protein